MADELQYVETSARFVDWCNAVIGIAGQLPIDDALANGDFADIFSVSEIHIGEFKDFVRAYCEHAHIDISSVDK